MNRERAISLLQCTADPLPPEDHTEWDELAQYLEQNPELQKWFESGTALDRTLRAVVEALPAERKIISVPPSRWTRRHWVVSGAAGIAACLAVGYWMFGRRMDFAHDDGTADFAGFREDMARFSNGPIRLDKRDETAEFLLAYLKEKGALAPTEWSALPKRIASARSKGCKLIPWGAHKVGLVCFWNEAHEVVHLFSISAPALKGEPTDAELETPIELYGRECVGFRNGNMIHLLVAMNPGDKVASLLA